MTTQTEVLDHVVSEPRQTSARIRFGVAFLAGLVAAMALGAGALFAYDQQHAGRIVPGVSVGNVELSGLTPEAAANELATAYASLANKQGGAIINGRTEPQGALAGGICSCSTTLFNAALRAGFKMGARRNHFYYIDRYPLGLDATVFISGSGSKQTVSFTNDTDYPVLIRGYKIRKGSIGYVRFVMYSVPNGRQVSISTAKRRNIRYASDTIQYTSSLKPGVRKRIEYPVDGFQVTAVRTVRDKNGKVIHRDTYFSNYARITGVTLVGKGSTKPKPASPTP